jgi:hypothetical protein
MEGSKHYKHQNSVVSAGFDPDYLKWHISKRDVLGKMD